MEPDSVLLSRYLQSRDPDAFRTLSLRYADMVYAAALRITGCPQDAEEVAQDCFLALARHGASVRSSVAGYLHTLAVSRARDTVRGVLGTPYLILSSEFWGHHY